MNSVRGYGGSLSGVTELINIFKVSILLKADVLENFKKH
jgi:hypothetical protein